MLRLAAADDAEQPDARFVRYFASRVAELSGGSLRVRPVWDAAGQQTADYEARIARMVRDGEFELGWIGARAWDRLGITHFQALQAPFLVDDHMLLGRIATGSVGERMLAGLDGNGLVGLALAPDRLRYPFGVRHALASPQDFAGARVRVFPSRTTEALMRALGATPVQVSGDDVAGAVARREIDGVEASLGTNSASEGENFLTTNLALFPKVLTLFAGADAYRRLDEDQAAVIRKAARQTAAYAAAHPLSERALVRQFCGSGRPVTAVAASRDDLAALTQAAQPVYAELERDPETRALIAAIRELKTSTPADPVADSAARLQARGPRDARPGARSVHARRHLPLACDECGRARGRRAAAPRRISEDIGIDRQDDAPRRQVAAGGRGSRGVLGHVRDHRRPPRLRLGRQRR